MAIMAAQFSHYFTMEAKDHQEPHKESYMTFGASLNSPLSFTSFLKQVTNVIKDEMKDICGIAGENRPSGTKTQK